MQKFWKSVKIW